jgi:uncharacterized membrane protein
MAHGLGGDTPLPTLATNAAGTRVDEAPFRAIRAKLRRSLIESRLRQPHSHRSREGANDLHMLDRLELDRLESVRLVRARAEAHPAARAGLPGELH